MCDCRVSVTSLECVIVTVRKGERGAWRQGHLKEPKSGAGARSEHRGAQVRDRSGANGRSDR